MANILPSSQWRRCLSEPVAELADAARYLDAAVSAHLHGKRALAEELIRIADMPEIRKWTKAIWADCTVHVRSPALRASLQKELRVKARMPTKAEKELVHQRDGYHCRFCGMPVVRAEVRARIRACYPDALSWGSKEIEQHAALQAMWAQYDHIVPHAKGGTSDLDNLVLTCAPCNFGRGSYSLEEVEIDDPRNRPPVCSGWDGLERFR